MVLLTKYPTSYIPNLDLVMILNSLGMDRFSLLATKRKQLISLIQRDKDKVVGTHLTKEQFEALLRPPNVNQLPKYLPINHLKAVKRIAAGVYNAMVTTNYMSGLRTFELAKLKIEDQDFASTRIDVYKGKGNKDRSVYVSKQLIQFLDNFRGSRDRGYFFLSQRKNPFTVRGIEKFCNKLGVQANLPIRFTPYMLRHTYAVLGVLGGVDLATIQKNMGHSSLAITSKYLQLADIERERVIEEKGAAWNIGMDEDLNVAVPNAENKIYDLPSATVKDPMLQKFEILEKKCKELGIEPKDYIELVKKGKI